MMVVSCLEFPNKGLEKDVVEVSYLKDESEVVQVSVDDQKKTWKEHMENLMNIEHEWSDSINAIY